MVATSFAVSEGHARWVFYLALSLGINILAVQLITLERPVERLIETPSIKLHLSALSRSTVNPVPSNQSAAIPMKAVAKSVIVAKKVKKKVAASKPTINTKLEKQAPSIINQNIPPLTKASFEKPMAADAPATPLAATVEKETKRESDLTQGITIDKAALKPSSEKNHTLVVHEAKYRKKIAPLYPRRAFELGYEGTVTLHAKVMTNGLSRELKVMQSSGYRLLDKAAVAAVKSWEFEPTNINGRAVVSWVKIPVNFVIKQ